MIDLSRGSVELYLSRQDDRHVVRYRERMLELDTARVLIDALGAAIDELDDDGDGLWSAVDFSDGEVVLSADHDDQQVELWGEAMPVDDARDLLDGLGDALDTADELELAALDFED